MTWLRVTCLPSICGAVLLVCGVAEAPALAQSAPASPMPATSCRLDIAPPQELGSYNRANLRAMIEEPEDLCTGRPLSAPQAEAVLLKNSQTLSTLDSQKSSESGAGAPKP